jgi:hypothetical protein
MRLRVLAAVASIAATSSLVAPALAQSGATLVAIVTAEPNAPLTKRVRAELLALGVDVLVLRPPDEAGPSREPLEQAARSVGAAAAVRLVASREGKVEVWVADRVTGKAVVRQLDAPTAGGAADETVAVGAVELLRASLMELHAPSPPRGEVPPTAKLEALALPSLAPPAPRLGLALLGGAELGVAGLAPSPDAGFAVWARIAGPLGARVVGLVSAAPSHTGGVAGAVDVSSQLAGLLASYDLADAAATWVPRVELGVGAAHVTASGTGAPPFVGASDSAWVAAPMAGAGVAWSFARGLRLRADVLAAWALPAVDVKTPAGTAGRWGAPAIVPTLGLEILWGAAAD